MNDKVDVSNTKLSVSEIAFHKKVINTLEPNFLICPQSSSLPASKGKPSSFLINAHISNPRGGGAQQMFIRGGSTSRFNPYTSFCLEKGTPFVYYLPLTNGTPFTNLV